jgi:hypothetical protein
VCEILRKAAFPNQVTGAAWLRWSEKFVLPLGPPPVGVLVFVRLTFKRDPDGKWSEMGPSMHLYRVRPHSTAEVAGVEKGELIRALLDSTVRKSAGSKTDLSAALEKAEKDLTTLLWKPSEGELHLNIRHAIMPLFAAILTD